MNLGSSDALASACAALHCHTLLQNDKPRVSLSYIAACFACCVIVRGAVGDSEHSYPVIACDKSYLDFTVLMKKHLLDDRWLRMRRAHLPGPGVESVPV